MLRLLIVSLFVFSSNLFAESVELLEVQIAKNELVKSLESLANREAECKAQAEKLPADEIKKIDMSEADLKAALAYFYMKTRMECVKQASFEVVAKMAVLDHFQPQTKGEGEAASKLIVSDYAKVIKLQSEYLVLNKAARDRLSDIPELNKPFDLVDSFDDLGL